MAIRYSGDVEVRMAHTGGFAYDVAVRDPDRRVKTRMVVQHDHGAATPEGYDYVAVIVLHVVDKKRSLPVDRKGSRIVVRRVFQAPCPLR